MAKKVITELMYYDCILKHRVCFYGYTVSYTADGKLSIVFKDAPDKLSDAIVALDAGHGGKDCGTIGVNGIYESEVNLNITFLVKEKLEKAGVNVVLTRSDNTFLSVDKKTVYGSLQRR